MNALAFDLGASSGRALIGTLDQGKIVMEEIHRFTNDPVHVGKHLHWDILRLFHEVKQGINKASLRGNIDSIGIDSWAVDFGFIGKNGELLANPYHYRDHQTDGVMEQVFSLVPQPEIFRRTGIQFLPFNTLFQLFAIGKRYPELIERADKLLLIPELLRYFLTGEMKSEFTNASTTQFLNCESAGWDNELLSKVGIPSRLFVDVVQPGTKVAALTDAVASECGSGRVQVIAVAEHDTGSAVAAVPAVHDEFAYLICGTWSLLGTELPEPMLSEQTLAWNFTNEGGVGPTYRLLKNIMGLWLIQECRRQWEKEGRSIDYAQMVKLASQEVPFRSLINPDDLRFLNPNHMPEEIRSFCKESGQPVPENEGQLIRCIMESLALTYRMNLERVEQLTGHAYQGLHMVGGGIQNTLLAQFTANAIGREVWAGPIDASAIGNLVMQWIAMGNISNLAEARKLIRHSFPMHTYFPEQSQMWEDAYVRFRNAWYS